MSAEEAAEAVAESLPGILARLRSEGFTRAEAQRLADEALEAARRSSLHPVGAWILSPHDEALTEARWTGAVGRALAAGREIRSLRADRVFLTAATPPVEKIPVSADESDTGARRQDTGAMWWIVDYKTSHAEGMDLSSDAGRSAFLKAHRQQHLGQLELYARMLRHLQEAAGEPASRVRAGLFYPRLGLFDFWEV